MDALNETTLVWIIVAVVAVAIVLALAVASRRRARARSLELQRRYGPEYARAVEELGTARGERELVARARRVERFQFRELGHADRSRFASSWSRVQLQFVDDPAVAVGNAHELIKEVMRARGYPTEDFEQRAADLSVDHPAVVQHYRAAQSLAASNSAGQASTEELRQAVVHYRVLFNDLLQSPSATPARWDHASLPS